MWPGHGPVIEDALAVLDFYLAHRRQRLEPRSVVIMDVERLARRAR